MRMRLKFAAIALARRTVALSHGLNRGSISSLVGEVERVLSNIGSRQDTLSALKEAGAVMAQIGDPTDHMDPGDANTFRSVITLVEDTIYISMDEDQITDKEALQKAAEEVGQCNTEILGRTNSNGDLHQMFELASTAQNQLDTKKGELDTAKETNKTQWERFEKEMKRYGNGWKACVDLPQPQTMVHLDPFFTEGNDFVDWYTDTQPDYIMEKNAWAATDLAVTNADIAYETAKATRDADYCLYSLELNAACLAHEHCYHREDGEYEDEKSRVTEAMDERQEIFKAGETLVHQIKFLLGDVDTQTMDEDISTARYTIDLDAPEFQAEAMVTCDESVLVSDKWKPQPQCNEKSCEPVTMSLLHFDVPHPSSASIQYQQSDNSLLMASPAGNTLYTGVGGNGHVPLAWLDAPEYTTYTFEVDAKIKTDNSRGALKAFIMAYDGPGTKDVPFEFGVRPTGVGFDGDEQKYGDQSPGYGVPVTDFIRLRIVRRPKGKFDAAFKVSDATGWIEDTTEFASEWIPVEGNRIGLGLEKKYGLCEIEFKNLVVHGGGPEVCDLSKI